MVELAIIKVEIVVEVEQKVEAELINVLLCTVGNFVIFPIIL